MRNGMDPSEAANDAISRIVKIYPNFVGAIIAMDKYGNHGMLYTMTVTVRESSVLFFSKIL